MEGLQGTVDFSGPDAPSGAEAETRSYTFDRAGNRLTMVVERPGATETTRYRYDDLNRLLSSRRVSTDSAAPPEETGYSHDINGNRQTKTVGGGTEHYTWDVNDRLVAVDRNGRQVFAASYDYRTRRVAKSERTESPRPFVGEAGVAGDGRAEGVIGRGEGTAATPAVKTTFFRYDQGDSFQELERSRGAGGGKRPDSERLAVKFVRGSGMGGGIVLSMESSENNRLANTKERDFSIGLDNHGFRYYDAEVGSYVSPDPTGYPDGLNNWLYVNNNAINWIDPLGLTLDVDKKKNKEKIEDEDLFRNTPFAKDSAERKIGQHIVNAMIGDKERAYRFRSMNELRDFMAFKIYLVQAGYALAAKRNSFGNPITAAGSANWTNEAANDTKLAAEQKALVSNGSTMRLQGIKLAQNGGVSQGLKEIFGEVRSEGTFTFECATAQELVYAKATMDYFVKYRGQSEAWFDQQCKYADLFTRFGGWRARFQRGGTLREDVGNPALDPEKIIPGDFRRFQAPAQPNDNGNYNTLYLGGGNFYGHDGGVIATFTKKNPQGGVRTFMDDQRHELRTDEAFRWKLPPFREQANAPSGR